MSVPFFTSRCCSLISLAVVVTLRDYLAGVSGAICADVVIAPVTGAFVSGHCQRVSNGLLGRVYIGPLFEGERGGVMCTPPEGCYAFRST